MFRDKLVSFADEPQKSIPQSKAAHSQSELRAFDAGVRGGVCRFAAAFADVGVCACAWAAVKAREKSRYSMSEIFHAGPTGRHRIW
jgi:hypothetical protein